MAEAAAGLGELQLTICTSCFVEELLPKLKDELAPAEAAEKTVRDVQKEVIKTLKACVVPLKLHFKCSSPPYHRCPQGLMPSKPSALPSQISGHAQWAPCPHSPKVSETPR